MAELIVVLDVDKADDALVLVEKCEGCAWFKVGMQEAPGVRPEWSSRDDQQRIMTPGDAARAGADFVAIGRPILHHNDPAVAVGLIEKELS